jgi:lysophospholipase
VRCARAALHGDIATAYDLPNSNHAGRLAIHDNSTSAATDRRAIPADARESTWQAADGHAIRRIDWPGTGEGDTPRGSILFFPGRGDFYEKYLETLDQWHREGWRVTASDWRGQAGSGRLGKDAVTGHVDDFNVWVDDLAYFWPRWVAATPGPHVLAAHSMGGHLVLRALVDHRVSPDAAVLSAPMTGVSGPPLPLPLLQAVAKLMCTVGDPTRQAWKWSEKPGELPADRADLLTHDAERYADEIWWRDHRPQLVMGPASWRWVERAYASTRRLEAAGAMEAVDVPVLILSTSSDKLVSHPANLAAARRLPKGELVALGEEAHHEILREVDAVRDRVIAAISEFLDREAPQK